MDYMEGREMQTLDSIRNAELDRHLESRYSAGDEVKETLRIEDDTRDAVIAFAETADFEEIYEVLANHLSSAQENAIAKAFRDCDDTELGRLIRAGVLRQKVIEAAKHFSNGGRFDEVWK